MKRAGSRTMEGRAQGCKLEGARSNAIGFAPSVIGWRAWLSMNSHSAELSALPNAAANVLHSVGLPTPTEYRRGPGWTLFRESGRAHSTPSSHDHHPIPPRPRDEDDQDPRGGPRCGADALPRLVPRRTSHILCRVLPQTLLTLVRQAPEICALYTLQVSPQYVRQQIRRRFEESRHVTDLRVINHLLLKGRQEYQETMNFWKQKDHVMGKLLAPRGRPPRTFLQKFYEGVWSVESSLTCAELSVRPGRGPGSSRRNGHTPTHSLDFPNPSTWTLFLSKNICASLSPSRLSWPKTANAMSTILLPGIASLLYAATLLHYRRLPEEVNLIFTILNLIGHREHGHPWLEYIVRNGA